MWYNTTMIERIGDKLNLRVERSSARLFRECIADLESDPAVRALDDYTHHLRFSRLEHCLHVAYVSFLACRRLGLDYRAAARGGLLHDFYFYDSRTTRVAQGLHCHAHPRIALANALSRYPLNEVEQDIIARHMWPVTVIPPRFKESYVVSLMDKYCATREVTCRGGSPEVTRWGPAGLAQRLLPQRLYR
ncbi:MAG: HD family phosphohydrolase [Syntrophomonadaceae bacterium]|nr:HD family phosphohydrolase [Syntrophomonadaceae bacterium]